jgi:hypothetical protein
MYPVPWRYHFRFVIFNFQFFKLNYSKFKTSTKYDPLRYIYSQIPSNHQTIHNDNHFGYRTGRANLLGSGDVSEETRVRLRTFLEHKRYGNFDNLRLESSDSTYMRVTHRGLY